jgi:hypothetical protein
VARRIKLERKIPIFRSGEGLSSILAIQRREAAVAMGF